MCNLRYPFCYTCLHLKNPLAVLVKLSLWRLMQDVLRQAIHVSFCRRRQLSWNEGVQRLSELKCQSWNQIVNILSGLWTRCIHIWTDHTCMGVSVQAILEPAHALDQLVDDKDSSFPSQIRIRIVSLSLFYQPSVGRTVLGFLVRTLEPFSALINVNGNICLQMVIFGNKHWGNNKQSVKFISIETFSCSDLF